MRSSPHIYTIDNRVDSTAKQYTMNSILRRIPRPHMYTHLYLRRADTKLIHHQGINTISIHKNELQRPETLEREYLLGTNDKERRLVCLHVVSQYDVGLFVVSISD